jgi:hypothetical protein
VATPHPGDVFCNPGTPWTGKTVFCLGSGDSLRRLSKDDWSGIAKSGIVFAVNSSVKTARLNGCEPDALFFTDTNWYETNEALVRAFPGSVFTVCKFARAANARLERIETAVRPDFAVGQVPMRDGRTSGHRAVSIAIMCGARRVVLLGYDMRIDPVSGRSHCHDDYQWPGMAGMFADEFVPGFDGWYRDALAVGCEIVNATDGTALTEFPLVTLEGVLREAPDGNYFSIHPKERSQPV